MSRTTWTKEKIQTFIKLYEQETVISMDEIAKRIKVSTATANTMLARLRKAGIVGTRESVTPLQSMINQIAKERGVNYGLADSINS